MNAYELQALRHIFAMTIDECATWIAQTGNSESWRQWENGKCAIPDCVVEQLLAMRQHTIWSGFVNFSTERNCRCYNNNERILTQHRYTF